PKSMWILVSRPKSNGWRILAWPQIRPQNAVSTAAGKFRCTESTRLKNPRKCVRRGAYRARIADRHSLQSLPRIALAAALLKKCHGLDAGDLEALAAAHVLADHHVVTAQHVGLRFRELGPIAIVGTRRQRLFLGAHQPLNLVLRSLMAVRTVQRCRL